MSTRPRDIHPLLAPPRRAARGRVMFDTALHALPWALVIAACAWRWGTPWWLWIVALLLAAATGVLAWQRARAVDGAWVARRLDGMRADMDDSAALLLRSPKMLSPLQRLQRQRLEARLADSAATDLRPAWRTHTLLTSAGVGLLTATAIAVTAPRASPALSQLRGDATAPATPTSPPRLVAQRIAITPPTYTRLPSRTQDALSARVPERSALAWTLRFAPMPSAATLVFLDGTRVPLARRGEGWAATRRIDRAALYRIETTPAAPRAPNTAAPLHRIDVVVDRAPQLRVLQPARSLSLHTDGQRAWALAFEGTDDYAVDARAQLRITRTQGSGENITATTRSVTLTGSGTATRRRYVHSIDLGAIGLTAGDDLIVQLEVGDSRAPVAQRTRSPSVILRWPPQADAAASGLEGLLTKTMPAYFRSQRQIIIDAEALQKDKPRTAADAFAKRSDGIGADQRILRGRYSRFLGGEDEGAPTLPTNDDAPPAAAPAGASAAMPTNDMPTNDAPAPSVTTPAVADDDHAPNDGHDHPGDSGLPATPPAFGSAGDVLADFGHVHDQPEATTLLDPATREILRAALNEMWQAEVNLRQARPDLALPFAYKALGFIKQVQEATRIYLARTAIAPPPIDESRRLSGDRSGLAGARDGLAAATPVDPAPANAWRALQDLAAASRATDIASGSEEPGASARTPTAPALAPALDALDRWARSNTMRIGDPLALSAAIDAVRQAPACADCRAALRRALWPSLSPPEAAIGPRPRADAAGQAYLDALDARDDAANADATSSAARGSR